MLFLGLGNVRFDKSAVNHSNWLVISELIEAGATPMIRIVPSREIKGVSSNTLAPTLAIAIVDRRFKLQKTLTAKETRIRLLSGIVKFLFITQLRCLEALIKDFFKLFCKIMNWTYFGVVQHGIVKNEVHIILETGQVAINARLHLLFDCAKIHGVLDDIKVIGDIQLDRIDRPTKNSLRVWLLEDIL